MKIYCLFEQSGVFKNAFKDLGYEAYDVDICNDFGETDFQLDLFEHINYEGEFNDISLYRQKRGWGLIKKSEYPTFFDKITPDDLIMAFYPCTRFVEKNMLNSRCENGGMKNYTPLDKIDYSRKIHNEIHENYQTLLNLIEVCYVNNFKMILENPASNQHYLTMYLPFKPQVTIKDRTQLGDNYKKPTNFWFFNCEPKEMGFLMPSYEIKHKTMRHDKVALQRNGMNKRLSQVEKSFMTPEFARNFIKAYVI